MTSQAKRARYCCQGDEREAREIGHRRDVRVARELTDLAGCEAGEPCTFLDEPVEVLGRNELRTRPAVQVDELPKMNSITRFSTSLRILSRCCAAAISYARFDRRRTSLTAISRLSHSSRRRSMSATSAIRRRPPQRVLVDE